MKRTILALSMLFLALALVGPDSNARETTSAGNAAISEAEAMPVPHDEPDWCSNGSGHPRTFENLNSPSVKIHVNGNNGTSDASVTGKYADGTSFGPTTIPQGQSDTFQSHPEHGNVTEVSIQSSEQGVQTCGSLDAESPE